MVPSHKLPIGQTVHKIMIDMQKNNIIMGAPLFVRALPLKDMSLV